jgi:BirA family biotin operon repressor/biotin-[acetyl-CoA-carboxylase] ligase
MNKSVIEILRQEKKMLSSEGLVSSSDLMLPEEISQGLTTRSFGKRITYREECTSTQDLATELARAEEPEGSMVITEAQTRGRGRNGRIWISTPGAGVYLSVILRPKLQAFQIVQIPMVAGVAAARTISAVTCLEPDIKWPNDILLHGKKVAGTLTEMSCEKDRINYIILGIGINVNSLNYDLPEPVRDIATSLRIESGRSVSRIALVQRYLIDLETAYYSYLANGFENIRQEWKCLSSTIGARVEIVDGLERLTGEVLDIDTDGFLLLKTDAGKIQRIVAGDVSLRNIVA